MQAITPTLQLGGMGKYVFDKGTVATAFAGVYDDEEQMIAGIWDQNVSSLFCFLFIALSHTVSPPRYDGVVGQIVMLD